MRNREDVQKMILFLELGKFGRYAKCGSKMPGENFIEVFKLALQWVCAVENRPGDYQFVRTLFPEIQDTEQFDAFKFVSKFFPPSGEEGDSLLRTDKFMKDD